MLKLVKTLVKDFFFLLYPRHCIACDEALVASEAHICTSCLYNLPKTWYHYSDENPLAKMFWGRIDLEQAAAFLFYDKGMSVQRFIHEIKYRSNKELGNYLGRLYASDLSKFGVYKNADYLVPVPLHPKKEKDRGYNQSEIIAQGMSTVLGVPVNTTNLRRKVHTESQTKKNKLQRWENVRDIFELTTPHAFDNKHILLIDDVITTGATIESCAMALHAAKNIRITALSLGVPHH